MNNNVMNLSNLWKPFLPVRSFFDLDVSQDEFDILFSPSSSLTRRSAGFLPVCDIEEEKDKYSLTMEVPGIDPEKIKIEVVENQVSISGETSKKEVKSGSQYTERRFGKFMRSFPLPSGVDIDKVEANCKDGILQVVFPKNEHIKPKQIKVNKLEGQKISHST